MKMTDMDVDPPVGPHQRAPHLARKSGHFNNGQCDGYYLNGVVDPRKGIMSDPDNLSPGTPCCQCVTCCKVGDPRQCFSCSREDHCFSTFCCGCSGDSADDPDEAFGSFWKQCLFSCCLCEGCECLRQGYVCSDGRNGWRKNCGGCRGGCCEGAWCCID